MKQAEKKQSLYTGMLLGLALLLGACGGGGGGSNAPTSTTVSGTAATGAPIPNVNITLHCQNNWTASTTADSNGHWSYIVPITNLPCAIKASNGTDNYYSFTVGSGNAIITNISPLTSLALAKALGNVPGDAWFDALDNTGLQTLATALPNAIMTLNTLLAGYALPAGFNPVTMPLTPPASGQPGNSHDQLLDQLQAALGSDSFDDLLTDVASSSTPTLPVPPRTPGATSVAGFFTSFAGDYSLKVTASGAEGSNNGAVTNLFPLHSARTVHIKANGDVSIDAVGRSITWTASTYNGSVGVGKWTEFEGTTSTENIIRYRQNSTIDLYITYNPANGELSVMPQGFVNNEGYATLKGTIFVPPPTPPADDGDDSDSDDGGSSASGQSGNITFSKTGTSAVAADISTLTNTYTGTIGRVFDTGAGTIDTTTCTITVAANGDITVASGSKTITASINGDVGDVITGPINVSFYNVLASDTANNKFAQVTIVNGYITEAVARNGGYGFSDATDRVECKISNPNTTMSGTLATANIPNGATAANIDSNYVGNFSNGSCTLNVSNTGELHLVTATADVTTSLGGDEGDNITLFPSIDAVVMRATDFSAGGKETYIEFMRSGTRFQATARIDQPRPAVLLVTSECDNLIK